MNAGGRTVLSAQRIGGRGRRDEHLVVAAGHLLHGEGGGRPGDVDDQIHALLVEPLIRDRGGDVGLLLVVGEYEFDVLAAELAAPRLDGHSCGFDGAFAREGLVFRRQVRQHADLDLCILDLGL